MKVSDAKEKVFTHYGFQSSMDRTELETNMLSIGIRGFMDFDVNKDGMYFMSCFPIDTKTISDFSDQDLLDELTSRGYYVKSIR